MEKEERISPSTHWRDFAPSHNSTRINVISEIWGPSAPRDGTQNQDRPKLTALHHLNRHQQTHTLKRNTKNCLNRGNFCAIYWDFLYFKDKKALWISLIYDNVNKSSTAHQKKVILYLHLHNALTGAFLIHRQPSYVIH